MFGFSSFGGYFLTHLLFLDKIRTVPLYAADGIALFQQSQMAGLLLDSWLHTSPIFTLIGMVVGIAAAMYTIWDVARDAMRR